MKLIKKRKLKNNKQKFYKEMYKYVVLMLLIFSISCSESENTNCNYEEDIFPPSCNKGMDVAFLIDYTGSMGSAIDDIKSSVSSIASTIVTESSGDYRLSLSIFDEVEKGVNPSYFSQSDYSTLPISQKKVISTGSASDQFLTMMEPFGTNNQASFSTQLGKLNGSMFLGYGRFTPEPGGLLLNEILSTTSPFAGAWRNYITKLVIIITDAPAGGDDDAADTIDDTFLSGLANDANSQGVQCVLVTSLGSSNYEVELIDNNTDGVKLMNSNLNNVATDIISLIETICIENNDE